MQTQKKRTFYIVHLDHIRILIVGLILFALLFVSYTIGGRMAQKKAHSFNDKESLSLLQTEKRSQNAYSKKERLAFSIYERRSAKPEDPYVADADSLSQNPKKRAFEHLGHRIESTESNQAYLRLAQKERTGKKKKLKKTKKKRVFHARRPHSFKKDLLKSKKRSQKKSPKKTKRPNKKINKDLLTKKKRNMYRKSDTSFRDKAPLLSAKKGAPFRLANTSGTKLRKKHYYSLQTGSFRSQAAARRMSEGLKKQGFRPRLLRGKGTWVVRIGREGEPKRLWKLENRLRSRNYAPVRVHEQ